MYTNTVYTLVNGRITHQKRRISEKRWYYAAWHFQSVNALLILWGVEFWAFPLDCDVAVNTAGTNVPLW